MDRARGGGGGGERSASKGRRRTNSTAGRLVRVRLSSGPRLSWRSWQPSGPSLRARLSRDSCSGTRNERGSSGVLQRCLSRHGSCKCSSRSSKVSLKAPEKVTVPDPQACCALPARCPDARHAQDQTDISGCAATQQSLHRVGLTRSEAPSCCSSFCCSWPA